MFKSHSKNKQSLNRTTCNDLERYLLNKSKRQKINGQHHPHLPLKDKHSGVLTFDSIKDGKCKGKGKIVRPLQKKASGAKVFQLDLSIEKQPVQGSKAQEVQKHKKMKSNKTLLGLLLNHFHLERFKNETMPDSDTSSQNITSHQASLHKYVEEGKNDQENSKQGKTEHSKRLPQCATFYVKGDQKKTVKYYSNARKSNFFHIFPQINDRSKQQVNKPQKCKNRIFNKRQLKSDLNLNTSQTEKSLYRYESQQIKMRVIQKQNRIERSSQQCFKLLSNQRLNINEQKQNKLNPWSTTMIKGEFDQVSQL